MKNKLSDLNNHLFSQLERLSDESVKGEELDKEVERAKAVSGIAKDIISNSNTVLQAKKLQLEYGMVEMPALLEERKS